MRLARKIGLIASMISGCSAPPAPKPPQASEVASTKSAGEAPQAAGPAVSTSTTNQATPLTGAKVGPAELQKQVSDCNSAGNYFNRPLKVCDPALKLATYKCDEASLRAANAIRPNEVDAFNKIVQDDMNNPDVTLRYLFDQCVVPTVPDPADGGKSYRLKIFLAREVKVANGTRIDTKVVRFDP